MWLIDFHTCHFSSTANVDSVSWENLAFHFLLQSVALPLISEMVSGYCDAHPLLLEVTQPMAIHDLEGLLVLGSAKRYVEFTFPESKSVCED